MKVTTKQHLRISIYITYLILKAEYDNKRGVLMLIFGAL